MGERELFLSFNQDYGCFAVGSDQGFHIYNVEPFQKMFNRDFSLGGIVIVEMLYRSNILALVGGGLNPRYPANKVMIWDDHQARSIGEINLNKEKILAVKLKRDLVVVVVLHYVYLYNFRDLKLMERLETCENRLGLVSLSPSLTRQVLAMPGNKVGQVRIENPENKTVLVQAHEGDLQCMTLNAEGTMIATASIKGTLIRVFNCENGEPLFELRRGAEQAIIHCISFNLSSTWLVCSSDKGTCHVFELKNSPSTDFYQQQAAPPPSRSNNSNGGALLETTSPLTTLLWGFKESFIPKYFKSEWSYAQFRLPPMVESHNSMHRRIMVAFGTAEKNTIVVVSTDGRFFRASFDGGPGECVEKSRERFCSRGDDDSVRMEG